MHIGIVGASGEVGRMMLKVLSELEIEFNDLSLFGSKRSAGKEVDFKGKKYIIKELTESEMKKKYDYLLFSAGSDVSRKFAPIAAKSGNVVIDNSSAFRRDKKIPLIVPEINSEILKDYSGIVANPNCSTIQLVLAINKIHEKFKIKKIIVSTYQAVSGAGHSAIQTLKDQKKGSNENGNFSTKIDDNVIPKIDRLLENNYTFEEDKIKFETKKILREDSIEISATAVRVPVINGHSESIFVECEKKIEEAEKIFKNSESVKYHNEIITTVDIQNSNYSHVCRLRKGFNDYSIVFWNVAHNLRVGAATNTIRIMKKMMEIN